MTNPKADPVIQQVETGNAYVQLDYSQIELRLAAHFQTVLEGRRTALPAQRDASQHGSVTGRIVCSETYPR